MHSQVRCQDVFQAVSFSKAELRDTFTSLQDTQFLTFYGAAHLRLRWSSPIATIPNLHVLLFVSI